MFGRSILALSLMAASHAATADDLVALETPAETAHLTSGESDVLAYFIEEEEHFQLTILITDEDGEPLRIRLPLVAGQSHSLVIQADVPGEAQRFTFTRQADRLVIAARSQEWTQLAQQ